MMTKRTLRNLVLITAGAAFIVTNPTLAQSTASRETPVVRAYQKNKDAVVSIATKQTVRVNNDLFSMRLEDFFPFRQPREQTLSSLGSGFIIHPKGYIITNAHVVAGADEITIIMPDDKGTNFTAEKIAEDPSCDLAVVRIRDEKPFPTVQIGYSDDLMIGETVLAIGNPYGFRQTLTDGIISAIHRDLQISDEFTLPEMIQISAPINFGNSGGPLINIDGQVIGINTAIRKAAQNIGFAIPIDRLREKLPQLLDIDKLRRTDLGLEVGDVRVKTAQTAPENQAVRVVVRGLKTDSGAEKAGLKVGDVILAVNGQKLTNALDFYLALVESNLGDQIQIDALHPESADQPEKGKTFTAAVTLHARPAPDANALAWALFGLKFQPATEQAIRNNGLAGKVGQLAVTEVRQGSLADQSGIIPGDILISLGNGSEVPSLTHFGLIIENVKPDQIVTFNFARTKKVGIGFQQIIQFSIPLRAAPTAENPPQKQDHIEL